MCTRDRARRLVAVVTLLGASTWTLAGCALSQRASAARASAGDAHDQAAPAERSQPAEHDANGEAEAARESQLVAQPSPWSLVTTMRNVFASNANFDEDSVDSYGAVLASAVHFDTDAFEFSYEIAGHSYTNTNRWDRVSHSISASLEQDLPGNWDFEVEGLVGFKGSSEDRDVVDQDFDISPQLEYRFASGRRLLFFTRHRLKRYEDAPETNAVKHYAGLEFVQTIRPRHYVELGARYETNNEQRDRSDSRRWTYWVAHGIPLTGRDALALQVRYRLKRYTHRFVEVEDADVLRFDHRWSPSIGWVRTLSPKVDFRFDYGYETNYSNDPEKEYGAHMTWIGMDYRWR